MLAARTLICILADEFIMLYVVVVDWGTLSVSSSLTVQNARWMVNERKKNMQMPGCYVLRVFHLPVVQQRLVDVPVWSLRCRDWNTKHSLAFSSFVILFLGRTLLWNFKIRVSSSEQSVYVRRRYTTRTFSIIQASQAGHWLALLSILRVLLLQ